MKVNWTAIGALMGALAVGMGAFGAHGLKSLDPTPEALDWWKTAAHYHLLHAVALAVVGLLASQGSQSVRVERSAGICFLSGIVIFSGTLYAMAVGAPKILGAVTPIGGILLILGWLLLAKCAGSTLSNRMEVE
ncbi:MAG: DUF423 domain-containing protein [Planctomycetes bacterium]|nr:DUF423 domain-containing protein [Planctomycetota bacterium]